MARLLSMSRRPVSRCGTYLASQAGSNTGGHDTFAEPSLTLSRQCGTEANTIAFQVCELMQKSRRTVQGKKQEREWTFFDKNLVEAALNENRLPANVAEYLPEDIVSPLTSAVEEILGLHPAHWTLLQHTTATILKLAEAGRVVVIGRGAHVITSALPNMVHVRLIAPLSVRVRNIREMHSLSEKEALAFIEKTDLSRARYVKRYFSADIEDTSRYDLVINTGRIDCRNSAKIIAGLLKKSCK